MEVLFKILIVTQMQLFVLILFMEVKIVGQIVMKMQRERLKNIIVLLMEFGLHIMDQFLVNVTHDLFIYLNVPHQNSAEFGCFWSKKIQLFFNGKICIIFDHVFFKNNQPKTLRAQLANFK